MRNMYLTTVLLIGLTLTNFLQLYGQSTVPQSKKAPLSKVAFKNAPVLFKEGGKSYQQVLASYQAKSPGKIVISRDGKEMFKADLIGGINTYLLTVPAVTKPKKITFSVKVDNSPAHAYPFTLLPPKKWGIDFVQMSHTDIGYTRPQSEILGEHMRYIDYALDYCDQTENMPDEAKFRWTCESAWVTREYLRSRPASQIERFKKRVAEGRIEVTGMYFNMSEVADENIMYDFLQPLKEFDKAGIPVKMAMQDDVNGIAWCLPDYFKNTGIKYLNMGINQTRSILPFDMHTAFWWEAPSGERLLAMIGHLASSFGIESKAIMTEEMLGHLADLESKGYPFDRIAVQFPGYRTDNSPPSTAASELVKQWNAKYDSPKLRLAVVSEFFEYIEKNYAQKLPVRRNAWLDWWTDGFGSISRETAEVRETHIRKQVGEGLFTMVSMMGGKINPAIVGKMDHISENALFFGEHTVGSNESILHPFSENSTRQWLQKSAYAWEAVKKVTLLNEEALGLFQEFLKKADFPVIYVINSMGWERSGSLELFIDNEIFPVDKKVRVIDLASGVEVPAQVISKRAEGAYWTLEVKDIPAMGYKALKIEVTGSEASAQAASNVQVLENKYYKVIIDKTSGSISSLFDKVLSQELLDEQNPYNIGQLVRETSAKRDIAPFIHTTASNVKVEPGTNGPVWESVRIASDLEGFEKGANGAPKGVELEIRLYKNVKKIEFKYMARKLILTDPEALYVAFPFSLPDSKIVFETIGGILTQGQQLHGSASDWNTSQSFVSVRGKKGQIIVVSNEAPLWHFSDFNMGKFERYPKPGKTWLYSWVMNNYWYTNFRAFQEGAISWSYQLTSTADTTNTYATKYAWSERNSFLSRTLPAGSNQLKSPLVETLKISGSSNAILVNSRPAFKSDGTILLHFRELEGLPAEVKLSSSINGRPVRKIVEVNVSGKQVNAPLTVVRLKPFEVKFIEVEF